MDYDEEVRVPCKGCAEYAREVKELRAKLESADITIGMLRSELLSALRKHNQSLRDAVAYLNGLRKKTDGIM